MKRRLPDESESVASRRLEKISRYPINHNPISDWCGDSTEDTATDPSTQPIWRRPSSQTSSQQPCWHSAKLEAKSAERRERRQSGSHPRLIGFSPLFPDKNLCRTCRVPTRQRGVDVCASCFCRDEQVPLLCRLQSETQSPKVTFPRVEKRTSRWDEVSTVTQKRSLAEGLPGQAFPSGSSSVAGVCCFPLRAFLCHCPCPSLHL